MCLFTHFAFGAVVGAATGHVGLAAVAGLVSHALLDAVPHYDFADWRVEILGGAAALLLLLLSPFSSWPAVVGGLLGMLPDLENLMQKLGKMERKSFIFPSHTGLIPHGRECTPQSVIWQGVLTLACFTLLGVMAPGPAAAQPPTTELVRDGASAAGGPAAVIGPGSWSLLASDSRTTEVQVLFPAEKSPASWRDVDPRSVLWADDGPAMMREDGSWEATPPAHSFQVAIPRRAAPRWRVSQIRWWRQPDADVQADDLVSVSPPSILRDVPLSTVTVYPRAAAGGILASITLVIEHSPTETYAGMLAASKRAPLIRPARQARPATVINSDLFEELQAGARQVRVELRRAEKERGAKQEVIHPFSRTGNWIRLHIAQTGVYALDGMELSLLGVATSAVDPGKLRLFKGGDLPLDANPETPDSLQADRIGLTEVAILVEDFGDDGWDSDDRLIFYAFGSTAWLDRLLPAAGPLEHFEHPFADRGVYWLTWESEVRPSPFASPPRRISTIAAPALSAEQITAHRVRLHQEQSSREATGLFSDNWAWDTNLVGSRELNFTLTNPLPDSEAQFIVYLRGAGRRETSLVYQNHARAWLNDDEAGAAELQWFMRDQTQPDSTHVRLVGTSTELLNGLNRLTVMNMRGGESGVVPLALDAFQVLHWSELRKAAGQQLSFTHWADQVSAPGSEVDLKLEHPIGAAVRVWDVTLPGEVVQLEGSSSGEPASLITFGLVRDPASSRHFVAFADDDLLSPAQTQRQYPIDLRRNQGAADYVVIHDPRFVLAAQRLAEIRSRYIPGIDQPIAAAVSTDVIYNSFSGGQKDLYAIRNFLHWLRNETLADEDPAHDLLYVCFMGDASRDFRNYLQHDAGSQIFDFMPTEVRTSFPALPLTGSFLNAPYATDDGLVSFDAATSVLVLDIPDLAAGRLTVRTAEEAQMAVDSIENFVFDLEPGPWRNLVCLAADDLFAFSATGSEQQHTLQAERLIDDYLPESVDVAKLYLIDYPAPPGGQIFKPAARAEAKRLFNEGLAIFHYIGHGSPDVMADERLFERNDATALANGNRRGLFMAFSCDVGIYDDPDRQSMAEIFTTRPTGGMIAAICASQVSWITPNNILSNYFYANLYPGGLADSTRTLGQALQFAKINVGETYGNSTFTMGNAQRYILFGDPALSMPHPWSGVEFTAASADSLRGGRREIVEVDLADLELPAGADVAYDLRIEESWRERSFVYNLVEYDYWLPGSVIFRGTGQVEDDLLRIPFKVPVQLRYGSNGRVRIILEASGKRLAAGERLPIVPASTGPVTDLQGPRIDLAFADGRYRVRHETPLQATVSDTSGINILGTNQSNSVLLEYDDNGFLTDVSDFFVFDPGSYQNGALSVPLPADLPLGAHKAAMIASDVLGNVARDTLSFLLVAEGVAGIEDVTVFPNPTPGNCRLVFELSDPMSIEWSVYTLAGRRIKMMRRDFGSAGPKVLEWDGRDASGDEIANGVYLYVLRGRLPADREREIRETGQLVIMK